MNGQDKLWGHENLNDKVECMRAKKIYQVKLLQIYQSITRVDRYIWLQLIFKNFRKLQIYVVVVEVFAV